MQKFSYLLGLLLLVSACGNPNQQLIDNAPLISKHFKDDLDREITLAKTPKRVVSLAPSCTEMIFAIGAANQLAAVSEVCDYPVDATDLPTVVTYPELDLAGIVEFDPDLVLVTDEIFDIKNSNFFDRYKIPLFIQSFEGIEDINRNLLVLGEMLEKEDAAGHLVDSLKLLEEKILIQTEGQAKFSTLVLIAVKPLIVAGGKSFINELVEKSGGKNAFGSIAEKYPVVTQEGILAAMPEVIIIPSRNEQIYQTFASEYPMLHLNMPAAQQGRVYLIDPNIVLRPGPRTVEGLAYLAKTLHAQVNTTELF